MCVRVQTGFLTFVVSLHKVHYPAVCVGLCMESAPLGKMLRFFEMDLLATSHDLCVSPACLSMKRENSISLVSLFACAKMCLVGVEICALDF